jgi:hypothetical protein
MLPGMSRWIREGPVARMLPTRFRAPLERWTVARGYPRSPGPLRWSLGGTREATILFGGDVALHRVDPAADPARAFAGLATLSGSADALCVNLETQLTARDTPAATIGASLRAAPGAIAVLSYLRARAVTCANNHCLDFGPEGLSESARLLESAGIAAAGIAGTGADGSAVLDVKGIRVALLAYTDDWRPAEGPGPVRPVAHDPAAVGKDIAAARARGDLVVVQLHWGYEWSMYPMLSYRDLARSYVEAGAHLVACHHAHVPMGVERWRHGAIAHGLGNLYFGAPRPGQHPFRNASFVLQAGFGRSGLTDLEAIPVATDAEGRVGRASGQRAEVIVAALGYLSRRLDRDDYLRRVQDSLMFRQGCSLLEDLARRAGADDHRGVSERIRFLDPPRQRTLTARLREAGGALGAIGSLLEDLRERRKVLGSREVMAELHSARAGAARYLARSVQKGRIP